MDAPPVSLRHRTSELDRPELKLVVYRSGAIGDSLTLTPFLASLRNLYEDITLIGNAERLGLIDPRLYDRTISYASDAMINDADLSIAFSIEPLPPFDRTFPPFSEKNIYTAMQEFAVSIGGDAITYRPPVSSGQGMIVHPGSGSLAKNAPIEFFLSNAADDALFVLGPAESEVLEKKIESGGFRWRRPETLGELKEVICAHAIFLGNDSGPAHIAALNGLETRMCFVSSDPRIWLPPGKVTAVTGI